MPPTHEIHTCILFKLDFRVAFGVLLGGTLGGAKMQLNYHPDLRTIAISIEFRRKERIRFLTLNRELAIHALGRAAAFATTEPFGHSSSRPAAVNVK